MVMEEDAGRFTPGPLSEVAAVHHSWKGLGSHLAPGPLHILHERSLRGEGHSAADRRDLVPVIDIPIDLQPWEPSYSVATYDDDGAHHDRPTLLTPMATLELPADVKPLDDTETQVAFAQMIEMGQTSRMGDLK